MSLSAVPEIFPVDTAEGLSLPPVYTTETLQLKEIRFGIYHFAANILAFSGVFGRPSDVPRASFSPLSIISPVSSIQAIAGALTG
jgi:hypothetical protein